MIEIPHEIVNGKIPRSKTIPTKQEKLELKKNKELLKKSEEEKKDELGTESPKMIKSAVQEQTQTPAEDPSSKPKTDVSKSAQEQKQEGEEEKKEVEEEKKEGSLSPSKRRD